MKYRKVENPHLTQKEIKRRQKDDVLQAAGIFKQFDQTHRARLRHGLYLLSKVYEDLSIEELLECGLEHWWKEGQKDCPAARQADGA